MKYDNRQRGIMMLHFAVMLFGLSAVIGRGISLPAHCVAWGRSLLSSLILMSLMVTGRKSLKLDSPRDYLQAVAGGIVLAFHWTSFFLAVKTASVAVGTVTFSAFPVFTVIAEPIVFREKPRKKDIILALVMTLGVIITVPELSLGNNMTQGALWGLGSAASYSVLALINRRLSAEYPAVKVCFYQQGTAAAVLLPFVLMTEQVWTKNDIIGVALIGAICTASAFSLFVSAQKYVSAGTAGVISGMETVYGMIFACIFLREFPDIRALAGGIIIITAAFISSLGKAEKNV